MKVIAVLFLLTTTSFLYGKSVSASVQTSITLNNKSLQKQELHTIVKKVLQENKIIVSDKKKRTENSIAVQLNCNSDPNSKSFSVPCISCSLIVNIYSPQKESIFSESHPFKSCSVSENEAIRILMNGNLKKIFTKKSPLLHAALLKQEKSTAVIYVDPQKEHIIFPALLPFYNKNGIGTISIKNRSDIVMKNITFTFKLGSHTAGSYQVSNLHASKRKKIPIIIQDLPSSLSKFSHLKVITQYTINGTRKKLTSHIPVETQNINTIDWSNPESIGAFITPTDKGIQSLASRSIPANLPNLLLSEHLTQAAAIYNSLWKKPLKYINDPVDTGRKSNIDTVQFPYETLQKKSGDCDDLTILLASLYESIGIPTVLIISSDHILLGVSSGTLAGGNLLFNLPEKYFVEVSGALYVPIETTSIGKSFEASWAKGISYIAKEKKNLLMLKTRDIWKKYPSSLNTKSIYVKNRPSSLKKLKSILPKMQKRARKHKYKSPKSYQIHKYIVKKKGRLRKPSKTSLHASLILWLKNKHEAAIKASDKLCKNNMFEACYNSIIMRSYAKVKVPFPELYKKTVSLIDDTVLSALTEEMFYGLGREIAKEAHMQKKQMLFLKKYRAEQKRKLAEKKKKEGGKMLSSTILNKPKSSKSDIEPALFKFFWSRMKKQN